MQHIQINMKNWHAQQLDVTNFWVAAWLDNQEVVCSFLFYLFVFIFARKSLFIFYFDWNKINMKKYCALYIDEEINAIKVIHWY